MIWAILLFAVTYVGMLTFSKYRPYIALGLALFAGVISAFVDNVATVLM